MLIFNVKPLLSLTVIVHIHMNYYQVQLYIKLHDLHRVRNKETDTFKLLQCFPLVKMSLTKIYSLKNYSTLCSKCWIIYEKRKWKRHFFSRACLIWVSVLLYSIYPHYNMINVYISFLTLFNKDQVLCTYFIKCKGWWGMRYVRSSSGPRITLF